MLSMKSEIIYRIDIVGEWMCVYAYVWMCLYVHTCGRLRMYTHIIGKAVN
jgi:hypothetical protein